MNRRRPARNLTISPVESLDRRIVPSGAALDSAALGAIVTAKGGPTLGAIYREYVAYEQSGGKGEFRPAESGRVSFEGTSVGVDVRFGGGDFNALVGQLKGIGMHVTATVPRLGLVEGYLPISALPAVAGNSHEAGLAPNYKPVPFPALDTTTQQGTLVARKGGSTLGAIYREYVAYEQSGGKGEFRPAESGRVSFEGTSVGVDVRFGGGDFNALVGQLKGIGMHVTATVPRLGLVEGYLPISALPAVAGNSHEAGLAPNYKPVPL